MSRRSVRWQLQEEEERRRAEAEERARKAKEEEERAAKSTRAAAYDAGNAGEARARPHGAQEGCVRRRAPRAAPAGESGVAITLFLLLLIMWACQASRRSTRDRNTSVRRVRRSAPAGGALGNPVATYGPGHQVQRRLGGRGLTHSAGARLSRARCAARAEQAVQPHRARRAGASRSRRSECSSTWLEARNVGVGRFVVKNLSHWPLALPKGLELEVVYADDGLRAQVVRGPDEPTAFTRKGSNFDDMSAASFTVLFAPEIMLTRFSMKGVATEQALTVSQWDGAPSTARLRRHGERALGRQLGSGRRGHRAQYQRLRCSRRRFADGKGEGSGKFFHARRAGQARRDQPLPTAALPARAASWDGSTFRARSRRTASATGRTAVQR